MHICGVPANLPFAWQLAHSTAVWAPLNGKRVTE
jgi:hypothetical protein